MDDAAALKEGFDGEVIVPGDAGFDDARTVFNAMIDKRPAVIAQCESAADVARALAFAQEARLEIAIRSGGHSVAGASLTEGGLVVDMRRMNGVTVDPEARTATASGGATWSDFDRATQPHGLATTGGRVSTTGVAGLTLGGGSGWLERKHGLACENLVSADLVTADGRNVTASEDENPELFWALHGGGGNFGVATSLTFRLHELPSITAALLVWGEDRGEEMMRRARDVFDEAPDEAGGGILWFTGPPEPFVPEHLHGKLAAALLITYAGPEDEARRLAAPLLELKPEGELIAALPYAELQCMIDDPPGYRNYWSAEYMTELPDAAIERFVARTADMIVPSASQQIIWPQGGALARASDIPVSFRSASWATHPFGMWEDPADDERARQWCRDCREDVREWATGEVYLNFIGDEGQDRVVAGYGEDNYARLAAVKSEYDPDNVFRLHHNVEPAAA